MVCAATCFHPDLATQLNPFEQFLDPITTDQLAPADRLFRVVYAVQLKDILCQIESNADKLHGGLLLSKPVLWKLQFDTNVPSGEEESIPLLWVVHGRPRFAKHSFHDESAGKDCTRTSGLWCGI